MVEAMIPHILLLLASQVPDRDAGQYGDVSPQVAAKRVAQCGAGSVTVRFESASDSDVLVIADSSSATDQQLACINKAASFYDVRMSPAAQPRLTALREARAAAFIAAEGRKWLAARKLLGRLPQYDRGKTDDAVFASQIEELCKARGALSSGYGAHAISPEWIRKEARILKDGPFTCLLNAAWASGYEVGFIGNDVSPRDR